MDSSKENRINPNNTVTPDLIVQMNDKYGIVGEVKIAFPENKEHWDDDFKQIQKYDDHLKGWITSDEYIESNDIVLLTHLTKKTPCVDYITDKLSSKEIQFNRNFAVVAFSKNIRAEFFMFLEKAYGNISDSAMNESLRKGINMPLNRFMPIYKIKFYDTEPPLPYLMCILWEEIIPQLANDEDLMIKKGHIIDIEVNCQKITEMLQEQFALRINHDDRQPDIPKKAWVKKALDKFEELGYAEKKMNSNEDYVVRWQNIRNTIDIFIKEVTGGKRISKRKEMPQRTKATQLTDFQ